jgi:hypothetical protein
MEKKIRKVQKWLERCVLACRSGSWENALAEMECANAEMEMARKDLWARVSEEGMRGKKRVFPFFSDLAFAGGLALLLVLFTAVPVSRLHISAFMPSTDDRDLKVEFVSSEEEVILQALRRSLSENGFRETVFTDSSQADMNVKSAMTGGGREGKKQANAVPDPVSSGKNVAKMPQNGNKRTALDMERLITLVQVGEKALRESGPAIEIKTQ